MHVVCVAGTRPNLVKLAPVLAELERRSVRSTFVDAAQHYDPALNADVRADLGLRDPDVVLATGSGSHGAQTAHVLQAFEPVLEDLAPDATLVFGDVNTTLGCALVAAKAPTCLVHVEAGLRSGDRTMPEEVNRRAVDAVSDLLLAPSADAVEHLHAEGADPRRVHLVGNTMVDSLRRALPEARARRDELLARLGVTGEVGVVTLHRPTNVDEPERRRALLAALGRVAASLPLVLPAHPRLQARLEEEVPPGVHVVPPLGYLDFLALQDAATVVLTDSGGVQEETSVLGVPCVTVRTSTERPITLTEGTNVLAGVEPDRIVAAAEDAQRQGRRPPAQIEGWDGRAAERIVDVLVRGLPARATGGGEGPCYRRSDDRVWGAPERGPATRRGPVTSSPRHRIPLAHPDLGEEELDAIRGVFASGVLTDGPATVRFEQAFAERHQVAHAVAMSSGTSALLAGHLALGIGPGDEVVVPSMTFISTATSVLHAGATPVFADVRPDTFTLDAQDVARRLSPSTKAIVAVHYGGQAADLDDLRALADDAGVALVEDAAEAHGATYRGRPVGGVGELAMFSFTPTKNITTGEGGVVTTDDGALAVRLRLLRNHGQTSQHRHEVLGFNFRMTEVQAAIGAVQWDKLDAVLARRRANAAHLDGALGTVAGVHAPAVAADRDHVYMLYTVLIDRGRDLVRSGLDAVGVESRLYFPPAHRQPIFGAPDLELAVTDDLAQRMLSLPVHPGVAPEDLDEVVGHVQRLATGTPAPAGPVPD